MMAVTFLFISFGLCGYLAFGETTSDIITLNLPNSMISKSVKVRRPQSPFAPDLRPTIIFSA